MADNGLDQAVERKKNSVERLESVERAVLQQLIRRASSSERAANDALRHLRAAIDRERDRLDRLAEEKPNNRQLEAWFRADPMRDATTALRRWWPELTGQERRRERARVAALLKRIEKREPRRVLMPIGEIDAEQCTRKEWLRWCIRKITRAIHEGRPSDVAQLAKAGAALLAELDDDGAEVEPFDLAGLARDLEELGPLLGALGGSDPA